MKRKSFKF
jgi:t-SNARE complex subunit (syntaxin)